MLKKIWIFFQVNKKIFIRVLFTLFILFLFRIGALITMPGISWDTSISASSNQFLSLLALLGGGVISKLSFFALGISPFITASIIVQLLSNGLIPKISKWTKEGSRGQTKLNYLTKFLTVPIGYLQSFATIKALENSKIITVNWSINGYHNEVFYYFLCPLMLLSGTMITLLLADLISSKGIGQGVSVIIFTGILVSIAYQLETGGKSLFSPEVIANSNVFFFNIIRFLLYISLLLMIFYLILFLNNSERRIPIQQTGSGLRLENQQKSYLPIKLNPSGVIPVIFASTIFSLFSSVSEIVKNSNPNNNYVVFTEKYLVLTSWSGIALFAFFIFIFTYIYAHIAINSQNIADNFKKNGVYILGILPGIKTKNYIVYIINRLVLFGSFYLTFLGVFSLLIGKIIFPDQTNSFVISGTSLLILIVIGENIIRQIKDLAIQARYLSFLDQKKDNFLW